MDKEEQLRVACENSELDEAKRLVDEEGVDVDSTNWNGQTPLIIAARNGHVDIIQFLLDRGANIEKRDNGGWAALHDAAIIGNDEIVTLLIERGANNLHIKTDYGETPLDIAKEYNASSTAAIIEAATKSIKVIYTSSQDLQQNEVTFKDFNNNIIILTDNNIPDGFEFTNGHPIITIQHIQHSCDCLDQLPPTADNEDDIPPDNLDDILTQRHPAIPAIPAITQRLQHWGMNLLHLIAYFPQILSNDMHEAISSTLTKYPQATTSIDIDGMTPLHHAIINLPKKKISQECHDLLLEQSPPVVVHKAIEAGLSWKYLHPIVMAKLDALTIEDEESGIVPFMIAAEKCNDDKEDDDGGTQCRLSSLNMAYELLCLQPDVLKEYE